MANVFEHNQAAIATLCRRYGVQRLDAFGSAIRGDFKPGTSDLDLLVEFAPMSPYARVDAYFGLLGDLEDLFASKVDLVVAGAIKNKYVLRNIERSKQPLYAA